MIRPYGGIRCKRDILQYHLREKCPRAPQDVPMRKEIVQKASLIDQIRGQVSLTGLMLIGNVKQLVIWELKFSQEKLNCTYTGLIVQGRLKTEQTHWQEQDQMRQCSQDESGRMAKALIRARREWTSSCGWDLVFANRGDFSDWVRIHWEVRPCDRVAAVAIRCVQPRPQLQIGVSPPTLRNADHTNGLQIISFHWP